MIASNDYGSMTRSSNTLVVESPIVGPVNTGPPLCYVSGTNMSTTPGNWTPTPASYLYQWVINDVPVPGATNNNYIYDIPTQGGQPVFVEVTAVGSDGGQTMCRQHRDHPRLRPDRRGGHDHRAHGEAACQGITGCGRG